MAVLISSSTSGENGGSESAGRGAAAAACVGATAPAARGAAYFVGNRLGDPRAFEAASLAARASFNLSEYVDIAGVFAAEQQ